MERGSSPPVSPRLHEVARRVMSFTFEQLETIGVHVWIPDEKFLSVFSSTLCSIVSTFSTTRGGAFLRAPRWLMGYFPPHTFFTHSSMARKHGARHDPAFFIYNCINPLVLILDEPRELSSISDFEIQGCVIFFHGIVLNRGAIFLIFCCRECYGCICIGEGEIWHVNSIRYRALIIVGSWTMRLSRERGADRWQRFRRGFWISFWRGMTPIMRIHIDERGVTGSWFCIKNCLD